MRPQPVPTSRLPVLLLLAMLVLLPSASACSFAAEPPRPATFTLVPHDGSAPVELEVDGRMSGADCGLANPIAYDDGVFAWMEYEWNPSRRIAVLYDLASGERSTMELRAVEAERFGLWNGKLLYREMEYYEEPGMHGRMETRSRSTFLVHDIQSGTTEEVPFPDGQWTQVLFDGPRIVAMLREPDRPTPMTLYVYDVAQGAFVVEGRSLADLASSTGWAGVTAAGEGWLAVEGDRTHLYELATGERHASGLQRVDAIVDGYAYSWQSWGEAPARQKLPDGPIERLPVKGPVVGFVPGYTIVGQYSPPVAVPVSAIESVEHGFGDFGLPLSVVVRAALFLAGPFGIFAALFGML